MSGWANYGDHGSGDNDGCKFLVKKVSKLDPKGRVTYREENDEDEHQGDTKVQKIPGSEVGSFRTTIWNRLAPLQKVHLPPEHQGCFSNGHWGKKSPCLHCPMLRFPGPPV